MQCGWPALWRPCSVVGLVVPMQCGWPLWRPCSVVGQRCGAHAVWLAFVAPMRCCARARRRVPAVCVCVSVCASEQRARTWRGPRTGEARGTERKHVARGGGGLGPGAEGRGAGPPTRIQTRTHTHSRTCLLLKSPLPSPPCRYYAGMALGGAAVVWSFLLLVRAAVLRNWTEVVHYIAQWLWLFGNFLWMWGELHVRFRLRHAAWLPCPTGSTHTHTHCTQTRHKHALSLCVPLPAPPPPTHHCSARTPTSTLRAACPPHPNPPSPFPPPPLL
jgi:hypothetical protein